MARLLREAGAELETSTAAASRTHGISPGGPGSGAGWCSPSAATGWPAGSAAPRRHRGPPRPRPGGPRNDFARALELPTEPAALAEVLLRGEPRPIDTIEVTSAVHDRTVVLGSVYAGVDALANHHANRARLLRGTASYYARRCARSSPWRATRYRVTVDGEEHAFTGYTAVAANSGYYGSNRLIAPSARVDDGLLEVVMIPRHSGGCSSPA